jgi:hypothetical protein
MIRRSQLDHMRRRLSHTGDTVTYSVAKHAPAPFMPLPEQLLYTKPFIPIDLSTKHHIILDLVAK